MLIKKTSKPLTNIEMDYLIYTCNSGSRKRFLKSIFLIKTFPILYCKQRVKERVFFDGYGQRSIVFIQVFVRLP